MKIEDLILAAKENNASDIHIICGLPPKYRVIGELKSMTDHILTHDECDSLAIQLAGEEGYQQYLDEGEVDLAVTLCDTRIRVNIFSQQDHTSIALRLLNDNIPLLDSLGLLSLIHI